MQDKSSTDDDGEKTAKKRGPGRPALIPDPGENGWLSIEQAAVAWNVSAKTVARAVHGGKLRARREGKVVYVAADDVPSCLEPGEEDPPVAALMRETRKHLNDVMAEYLSLARLQASSFEAVMADNRELRKQRDTAETDARAATEIAEEALSTTFERDRSMRNDDRSDARRDRLLSIAIGAIGKAIGVDPKAIESLAVQPSTPALPPATVDAPTNGAT